jgi:hypothetical protein
MEGTCPMQIVIDEIEKAIQAELFLSALALALTLPDICGRAAYPDIRESGKRYKTWYDEYITKYDEPDSLDLGECLKFDGAACWGLRCALFHSSEMPDVKFDTFQLSIVRPDSGVYSGGFRGYSWSDSDKTNRKSKAQINIVDLSFRLCQSAKAFYQSNMTVFDFSFANFEIIDIDNEISKLKELNG